jgi:hypothetical protein
MLANYGVLFNILDNFVMISVWAVRSKLEYDYVAWNSLNKIDFNKLELLQRTFCTSVTTEYLGLIINIDIIIFRTT